MYGHAADGFRDLRVVDADGTQVPWRTEPLPDAVPPRAVALVARGELDGVVSVVLDRGATADVIDRIELEVPDREFVGEVEVLGSSTGAEGSYAALSDDADLCRPWSRRRAQHDGALSVHGLPLSPRARSRRLRDRRRDRLPRSAPASSRRRRCSVERASTIACDRRDAGSRFPERPRRRGRGAVEHRHVRATCRRGGIERRYDVRLVGRCGGRALPRCQPRSNPGRRAPAIRAGHDHERRRRSTLGSSRAGAGTRPAARPRRGLHAAVSAVSTERLAWPRRRTTSPSLPAGAIGLDRAREGELGPEALNADFEAPADTRTFFERNPNVVNGLLVLAALVAAVGGFLALRRRA